MVVRPLDRVCEECSGPDHADKLLLCDDCDGGYHTFCLSPPIIDIPDGEWYCKACTARRDNAFG
jgi:histone demethylase JARID1